MKEALVIMAKAPLPGQVKTRLCPPLSPEEAGRLCRCFLQDIVRLVLQLADVDFHLAYHPPWAEPILRPLIPPSFQLWPQEGEGLAERMLHACDQLFCQGYSRIVIIGTDSPTLPLSYLQEAFAWLRQPEVDVVLGPSEDGGYYL
ncbi:MAG TPA: glycosyltransferase, partial [Anaerolineae bacterium]|nr:glycosyltransferase [Anaerolineae bacterium]